MAKIKRGEKLGEVVGKRHLAAAFVLIFAGAVLGLSILDYTAGQQIFFKETLEPFVNSTRDAGSNICGKLGATFCVISYFALGISTFIIPVYLLWIGAMCLRRSASAITRGTFVAIVCGLVLFSILGATMQHSVAAAGEQSGLFHAGWGGRFGTIVFLRGLEPFLSVFGSAALVGSLLFFCLIVVFVDSPIEAAKELAGAAKKSPSVFLRVAKILWIAISWPIKKLLSIRISRRDDSDADELGEIAALPRRSQKKNDSAAIPRRLRAERAEPEKVGEEQENSESSSTSPDEAANNNCGDNGAEKNPEDSEISESNDAPATAEDEPKISVASENIGAEEVDISSRFSDDDVPASVSSAPENSNSDATFDDAQYDGEQAVSPADSDSQNVDGKFTFKVDKMAQEDYVHAEQIKRKGDYVFPSIDLLRPPAAAKDGDFEDYNARFKEIVDTLGNFDGIKVYPERVSSGPVITRYEVKPAPGIRISRIAGLENDIAMSLKAMQVRVIAPIPGAGTVGFEVPNKYRKTVTMREIIESKEWDNAKGALPIALGKDVTGIPVIVDLAKMPHLLIAGATGAGKSVCINTIIISLLYRMSPADLRLFMVDPKRVELQIYNGMPHMLVPVLSEAKKVPGAFKWLIAEMDRRYKIFVAAKVKNIGGFNAKIAKDKAEREAAKQAAEQLDDAMSADEIGAHLEAEKQISDDGDTVEIPDEKLPYIVCIVDEFNDLMKIVGKELEMQITRLTQLARAAGIHVILATQRPSTDVITGVIKANLPARIALTVSSQIDSRTILDSKGAERLIGKGDMLLLSSEAPDLVRTQGAFVDDPEVEAIVNAVKENGEPEYIDEMQSEIDSAGEEDEDSDEIDGGEFGDPMIAKAVGVIKANKKASTSLLQRKLGIGYGRAARIIDELEDRGIIGPDKGQGQRDILVE